MNGLLLLHRIGKQLTAYAERKMTIERDGRMFCTDCGKAIHRGDRFKVCAAQHISCSDVKLNGQGLLPQPLGRMVAE